MNSEIQIEIEPIPTDSEEETQTQEEPILEPSNELDNPQAPTLETQAPTTIYSEGDICPTGYSPEDSRRQDKGRQDKKTKRKMTEKRKEQIKNARMKAYENRRLMKEKAALADQLAEEKRKLEEQLEQERQKALNYEHLSEIVADKIIEKKRGRKKQQSPLEAISEEAKVEVPVRSSSVGTQSRNYNSPSGITSRKYINFGTPFHKNSFW